MILPNTMRLFIGLQLVLSLAFPVPCRYASLDKKLFLQRPFEAESEVLLIVTMSRGREQEVLNCEIITNEKIMQDILKSSQNPTVKKPSPEDMQYLLEDCAKFDVRMKRSADGETYSENDRRNTSNDSRTGINGRNNLGESRTTSNRQNISSGTRPGNENNANESRSVINRQNSSNESSTRNRRRNNTRESPATINRKPFYNESRNESRSRDNRRNNTSYKENKIPGEENKSNADRSNHNKNNVTLNESAEDSEIEVATSAKETEDPNIITTTEGYSGWPVIFPGTKWCGAGDLAKDYDDLGMNDDSDRCCRAHDLCNDTLAPGATKNNLTNTSPFTKLSCKCDEDFYNCLDSVNSFTSNTIGNMYFNILRRECYQADYPLTSKCKTYRTFFKISCKEYERDTSSPMVYQWVSAKRYKKIPLPGPLSISLPFK